MRTRICLAGALVVALALSVVTTSPPSALADGPGSVRPAAAPKVPVTVNGTYVPIAGAFDCDSGSDDPEGQHDTEEPGILWYAPGRAPDHLWTDLEVVGGALSKTQQTIAINGTYAPLVGDFDGDKCSDILWYGSGGAADTLWWGGPAGFTQGVPITVNGTYRPTVGALGGSGFGILWYDPDGTESIWKATGNRAVPFVARSFPQVAGSGYQPVMFFNPWNGQPQVAWYAPGPAADSIWSLSIGGLSPTVSRSVPVSLSLSYRTASCGTFAVFHGLGGQSDHTLTISNTLDAQLTPLAIAGSYRVAASQGTRGCTIVWHGPGSQPDQIWFPNLPA